MYLVVSKWRAKPGREQDFQARGQSARNALRKIPGIAMLEAFWGEDGAIVVMGYESEDRYRSIVQDPEGPFEQVSASLGLEDVGEWAWSERGECVVD